MAQLSPLRSRLCDFDRAYALAIRHLGTVRGSMTNALMPVAAALGGIWLLGERLGATEWTAIVLASLGVATANGVFRRRGRRAAE